MNYYSQYNNAIPKNEQKKVNQTQPYPFFPSPSSSNNTQKQPSFNHPQKNSLKWRNIMKINLPQLQNSRDLNLLQNHLDNLVFGQISMEDVQGLPEGNIVKLIKILQTSCDIILNEQQDLEAEQLNIEKGNIELMNNYKLSLKNVNKNKESLRKLKKEKQRDLSVLQTYQNVINNYFMNFLMRGS